MSEGRLFLLAHIAQEQGMSEIKKKYKYIYLSKFELYYLEEFIDYNIRFFGSEWNIHEHNYLKLLFQKLKAQHQVKYNNEYNTYALIKHYEKYITSKSSLCGVIGTIEYD